MKVWNTVRHAEKYGIQTDNFDVSWQTVMNRKNEIINKIVHGKGPYLEKMGVDLVMGEAQFVSSNQIKVGEEIFEAERFLIGAGSESFLPQIDGVELAITSKDLLYIEEVPQQMIVVGGGIIAMEFAHMLASAGSEVTLVHRGDILLKNEDPEVSRTIEELSKDLGIEVLLESQVTKITETQNGKKVATVRVKEIEREIEVDEILLALGRKPAVSGLNLEKAEVDFDQNGIHVNEYFQTTNERIYAAGDVIGGRMFTTVATQEAKVAARNAITGNKHVLDIQNMSNAVFTLPPIGSVGLTEETAREAGYKPVIGKVPYAHTAAGVLMGETKGFLKIIADRDSRKIIGGHFIGDGADELIHLITVAIKGKLTVDDFEDIIPVHPTLAESLIETIRAIEFKLPQTNT